MICKNCALGADIQTWTNEHFLEVDNIQLAFNDPEQGPGMSVPIRQLAEKFSRLMHHTCSGSTHCDCQHREVRSVQRNEQQGTGEV